MSAVAVVAGCTAQDEPAPAVSTSASGAGLVEGGDGRVAEFTAPGTYSYTGDVRVVVHSLTVEGRTMELRVSLTPLGGDAEDDDGKISIFSMLDAWPVLSDVERLSQYMVIGRPNDTFETDRTGAQTVVGEPVLYQVWFPAPDPQAEVLDLVLHPSWPTVTDVPVTRR